MVATVSPCGGAQLPATFFLTDTNVPYSTHVPYSPATLYNPMNISRFIKLALIDERNTAAQQLCLGTLGAEALLDGSRMSSVPGSNPAVPVRWYPYDFAFACNPRVSTLQPGWISGLAQGAALGALGALADRSGDLRWI